MTSPSYVLERGRAHFIVSTVVSVDSWIIIFVAITILKTIQARPRKVALDSSFQSTLIHRQCQNLSHPVVQEHPKQCTCHPCWNFSHLCIFAYWPLVTGSVENYRIYHVLSNILDMLRIVFVALRAKLNLKKKILRCACAPGVGYRNKLAVLLVLVPA